MPWGSLKPLKPTSDRSWRIFRQFRAPPLFTYFLTNLGFSCPGKCPFRGDCEIHGNPQKSLRSSIAVLWGPSGPHNHPGVHLVYLPAPHSPPWRALGVHPCHFRISRFPAISGHFRRDPVSQSFHAPRPLAHTKAPPEGHTRPLPPLPSTQKNPAHTKNRTFLGSLANLVRSPPVSCCPRNLGRAWPAGRNKNRFWQPKMGTRGLLGCTLARLGFLCVISVCGICRVISGAISGRLRFPRKSTENPEVYSSCPLGSQCHPQPLWRALSAPSCPTQEFDAPGKCQFPRT